MADETPLIGSDERTIFSLSSTAPVNGDEDSDISVLDLLFVISKRKRMILRVTVGAAVLAAIVSLLLPSRYEASITLLTPQQNSSVSASLGAQLGNLGGVAALAGGGLGLKNPNDMFVGMLKGHFVEDAMVRRFDLMAEYHKKYFSDARNAFEGHTTVDGSGKDGLIHITVEDKDPHRAVELANGYVDQFRLLSQTLAITEASRRRLFFQQELDKAQDNLASAEEDLKRTELTTGLIQLDSQARALIESAASLRAQITAKEVQIQSMSTYAGSGNVDLMQAQQELSGLRAQLSKLGGSEDDGGSEIMLPKGMLPQAGLEYVRKVRDVKYREKIFEILAQQFELATLDEAKEGAIIQVVDPATVPDRRSFPKRGLIVIGATFLSFVIAIVIAFLQAAWSRSKSDPETALKLSRLRTSLSTSGGRR
jgi:tyrosine-protein kinase Etk/Wzc